MTNFTDLFTETLNKTVAELVAAAVEKETQALRFEIAELRDTLRSLEESAVDSDGVERLVESTIENFDFSDIVRNNMSPEEMFESREFSDAVAEVIVDALRR